MARLDEEILGLAGLITGRYAPEGIPIERADCRVGAVVGDRFLLDELGDYLQNVAALAPLLGEPGALDWALTLAAGTRSPRFRRGGLLESFAFHRRRWRRVRGLGLAFPYWNLDSLTGLVALYEVARETGRAEDARLIGSDIESLLRALVGPATRRARLRYGFEPHTGITLPLTSPQITGSVAEEMVRYGCLSATTAPIDAAAAWLRAECETRGFQRDGLFCAEVHGPLAPLLRAALRRLGKRHFFDPMLTKDNTMMAFALLALADAAPAHAGWARAVIARWREAVATHFDVGAGAFATFAGGPDAGREPRLTFNHSMIEWDIEAHVRTGSAIALERASREASHWVALQTPRGLFPEGRAPAWCRRSFLDPQVDLSVNLLKLAELTGDTRWREAALANLAAIRRDFRLPFGYAWEVDAVSGQIRQPVIEVKYLGLLLKGYLALREAGSGRSLLRTSLMWMLLRDR